MVFLDTILRSLFLRRFQNSKKFISTSMCSENENSEMRS